ncbi:Hpt domain-containing protein [Aquisediminimonas profunda]|uniref:Hpt domain-containing protein n=1 Tax=Aquisediminimonas profunda TaxID=1550733 RepID=UPI001C6331A2|nr:Hpt domain-containing protein [Aquisediminimonas profunda]
MAYEIGALDASLAAAVGNDPSLVLELRAALIDGALHYRDLLARSRCDANWTAAAHRLKGLAASFGAVTLIEAADLALQSAPGDPVALRKIQRAVDIIAA